jgi:hypothetical protein
MRSSNILGLVEARESPEPIVGVGALTGWVEVSVFEWGNLAGKDPRMKGPVVTHGGFRCVSFK